MPSKTGKKCIPANNCSQSSAPRKREGHARPSANRSANNRHANKRSSINKQTSHRLVPPKPPQKGYMIWGRHAVFAALQNNERRVAQIYTSSDYGETDLQSYLSALPPERRNNLPPVQQIKRERLDTLAGPHNKAVHQGLAAAVWPVEPPHLEDFLALYQTAPLRLILLGSLV